MMNDWVWMHRLFLRGLMDTIGVDTLGMSL